VRFYRDVLGMEIIYGGDDTYFSSLRTKDGRGPRHLGAEIGFFSVLHTWNQSSCPLRRSRRRSLARSHLLDSLSPSLLSPHSGAPAGVSRQVRRRSQVRLSTWPASSFRQSGTAGATQDLRCLAQTTVSKGLDRLLQTALRRARLCAPVSGPLHHRVAISNHRLISLADGQVTFRWRDSAHHNEQKLMTLSLDGFLRRVLLHLLPKGFVRIRHVGFLANCRRSTLLPLCLAALDTVPSPTEPETSATQESHSLWRASEKALALSLERARAYPAARSKNFGLEQGRCQRKVESSSSLQLRKFRF